MIVGDKRYSPLRFVVFKLHLKWLFASAEDMTAVNPVLCQVHDSYPRI